MDEKLKASLLRLLRNTGGFLWGLYDNVSWEKGRKQRIYDDLNIVAKKHWGKDLGLKDTMTYDVAQDKLIADIGIEELVNQLIIRRIEEEIIPPAALQELRNMWNRGERPGIKLLTHYNIASFCPLLEITTMKDFSNVNGWSSFSIIWFEIIEPYLRNSRRKDETS